MFSPWAPAAPSCISTAPLGHPQDSGTGQALDCVWGYAADDVYAVGGVGPSRTTTGAWSRQESGTSARLWAVRGLPGPHPVAVGSTASTWNATGRLGKSQDIAQGRYLYGLWDDLDAPCCWWATTAW